jgi:transposase
VNANQVFAWRKLYREGQLDVDGGEALLPVRVSEPGKKRRRPSGRPVSRVTGIIDIDLGHARLRIQGAADAACVRAALEGLRR